MTLGLMRRFSSSARIQVPIRSSSIANPYLPAPRSLAIWRTHLRSLTVARPREVSVSIQWFTSSPTYYGEECGKRDEQRLRERNMKLGNTIRILHERLPTLLASPLPQDILSPHISLHLFPSTHPHLPTVRGKIAYTAALWTAPVAWGRIPVLGNVKLKILSERMVKNGGTSDSANTCNEKLVVKWQTCSRHEEKEQGPVSGAVKSFANIVGGSRRANEEFSGLFIFEFDEEGRIINHIIEHTEEGKHWDKTTKVISVTDWLLGRAWRRQEEGSPSLAYARCTSSKQQQGERRGN